MTSWRVALSVFVLAGASMAANPQAGKIVIPAGTPEDQAIQAITNETDSGKRMAMWEEFVGKFQSNPQAVAYGNWQLSQLYETSGDLGKALEYGDKALTAMPSNLDILVSNAGVAQQMKNNGKVIEYASLGGKAWQGIAKQPKPEGVSDQDYASSVAVQKGQNQQAYDFLETVGYNAISTEQDAKTRLSYIEQYADAFPDSKFLENVNAFAILSVQQMNDPKKLNEFADKALAKNPDSLPTLILLANAYSEDQSATSPAKAATYARKAIELAKADAPDADATRKLQAGVAHSALGYALLKEEKTPQAIAELKTASGMLKSNAAAYSTVLYRLGFAYAKSNQLPEAKAVLAEAAEVEGPFQQASKDLLEKVKTAKPARRR